MYLYHLKSVIPRCRSQIKNGPNPSTTLDSFAMLSPKTDHGNTALPEVLLLYITSIFTYVL